MCRVRRRRQWSRDGVPEPYTCHLLVLLGYARIWNHKYHFQQMMMECSGHIYIYRAWWIKAQFMTGSSRYIVTWLRQWLPERVALLCSGFLRVCGMIPIQRPEKVSMQQLGLL
jgi:hypothetical protein